MRKIVLCAALAAISACSGSVERPSAPHRVTLYAGDGSIIRVWDTRGCSWRQSTKERDDDYNAVDGIYFEDKATGETVYASGTLVDEVAK